MIRLSRNRRIIYELKPNLDVTFKGHRVTTNESGFRGTYHPPEKTENAIRAIRAIKVPGTVVMML